MSKFIRHSNAASKYSTRKADSRIEEVPEMLITLRGKDLPLLVDKKRARAQDEERNADANATVKAFEKMTVLFSTFTSIYDAVNDKCPWFEAFYTFVYEIYDVVMRELRLYCVYQCLEKLIDIVQSSIDGCGGNIERKTIPKKGFIHHFRCEMKTNHKLIVSMLLKVQHEYVSSQAQTAIEFPYLVDYYTHFYKQYTKLNAKTNLNYAFDGFDAILTSAKSVHKSIEHAQKQGTVPQSPRLIMGLQLTDILDVPSPPNKKAKKRSVSNEASSSSDNGAVEEEPSFLSTVEEANLMMFLHYGA